MKQITLSKASTRNLSQQLDGKADGFTVKQLRMLDRIQTTIEDAIGDYNKPIDDLVKAAQKDLANDPSPEHTQEVNTKLNTALDEYTEKYGAEKVNLLFEDEQFSFIKDIWDAASGFRGNLAARKILLEIDDSLEQAQEVNVQAKKNETENNAGMPGKADESTAN